jgi:YD repeat-containing protein
MHKDKILSRIGIWSKVLTQFCNNLFTSRRSLGAIAALVVSIVFCVTEAQAQIDALRTDAPSPNAASLAQYGDHPVERYTGIPSIDVPLFTMESASLTIPLRLRYHASGNRVEDIASWVGLGWTLDAGGVITRTVRGLPDESGGSGYFHEAGDLLRYYSDYRAYPEGIDKEWLRDVSDGLKDSQPDAFSFNVGGYSGRLFFEYDSSATPINGIPFRIHANPKQDLKVTVSNVGLENWSWTITTPDGTIYEFAQPEVSDSDGRHYISSWYLTRVSAIGGADEITLAYQSGGSVHRAQRYEVRHRLLSNNSSLGHIYDERCVPMDEGSTVSTSFSQVIVLDSIKAGPNVARFEISDDRLDGGGTRLERIRILYNGEVTQRIELDTGYFGAAANNNRRLRLNDVHIYGSGSKRFGSYSFTYDPTALPPYSSFAQDYWGYFNGQHENEWLIPADSYTASNGNVQHFPGAIRTPSLPSARAGILTEITYPTGGSTQFEYELHQYSAPITGNSSGGGLRVRRIINKDGMGGTIVRRFQYSGGSMLSEPKFGYAHIYTRWVAGGELSQEEIQCGYYTRSSGSFTAPALMRGSVVSYSVVDEELLDGSAVAARTEYRYSGPSAYVDTQWPFVPPEVIAGTGGQQEMVTAFDASDGRMVSRSRFSHKGHTLECSLGVQCIWGMALGLRPPLMYAEEPEYVVRWFPDVLAASHLVSELHTSFGATPADSVYRQTTYSFVDSLNYHQIRSASESGSGMPERKTTFDYAAEKYSELLSRNMLAQVYRQDVISEGVLLARNWTEFYDTGSYIGLPWKNWIWKGGGGTSPSAVNADSISEFSQYDALGRITQQTDARALTVTFTYGQSNGGPHLTRASTGTHEVNYSYDSRGRLSRFCDEYCSFYYGANEIQRATRYYYDTFGRLDSLWQNNRLIAKYSYFSSANASNNWTYDPLQPNFVRTALHGAGHNENETRTITEFFDGLGRGIQSLSSFGDSSIVSAAAYDRLGRIDHAWQPFQVHNIHQAYRSGYSAEANNYYNGLSNRPDGHGRPFTQTVFENSPLARPIEVYAPGETVPVTFTYGVANYADANGVVAARHYQDITDEDGKTTRTYTDAFGRTIATVQGQHLSSSAHLVTRFAYDALDQLVKSVDPRGLISEYRYNERGLLVETESPDAGLVEYRYDRAGHLRFQRSANQRDGISGAGHFTYFRYDQYGRMTASGIYVGTAHTFNSAPVDNDVWPGTSGTAQRTTYTYDEQALMGGTHGRLDHVFFPGGQTYYGYTPEGHVREMLISVTGLGSKSLSYHYDRHGTVLESRYGSGSERFHTWYRYDAAGRLTSVRSNNVDDDSGAQIDAEYLSHLATGQAVGHRLGGVSQPSNVHRYTIRGWLTAINDPDDLGNKHFGLRLGYDSPAQPGQGGASLRSGNISSMSWSTAGNTHSSDAVVGYTFGYDAYARLVTANFGRKGSNGQWEFPSRYNVGVGAPIQYDDSGNILSLHRRNEDGLGSAINYHYANHSQNNRLTSVSGSISSSFTYDPSGNMTSHSRRGITGASYDYRNLPLTFSMTGGRALTYRYDPAGLRMYREFDDGARKTRSFYVRGAGGAPVAEYQWNQETGITRLVSWNVLAGARVIGKAPLPPPRQLDTELADVACYNLQNATATVRLLDQNGVLIAQRTGVYFESTGQSWVVQNRDNIDFGMSSLTGHIARVEVVRSGCVVGEHVVKPLEQTAVERGQSVGAITGKIRVQFYKLVSPNLVRRAPTELATIERPR